MIYNNNAIYVTTHTDTDLQHHLLVLVNQSLTAAKRKPHPIATKNNSTSRHIIAKYSMVRRITGDGLSSIQKREITSPPSISSTLTTSSSAITTLSSSIPVSQSNTHHAIQTTMIPVTGDGYGSTVWPYSMGKRSRIHG